MSPRHIMLMFLLMALWGFNFVPIRVGLDHVPPFTFAALRFLITFFPIIFFIRRPAMPWRWAIGYGLLVFGGQFMFLFSAIHAGLTAGLASLVMQSQAFFTIGFAALFFREKPRAHQITGALVAMCGIGVVGAHTGGEATLLSLVLIIGAAASWGGGNVLTKKFGKVDMFSVVIWGSFFAFPPLLVLAWMIEGHDVITHAITDMAWPTFLSLAYMAYISTFFGYTLWNNMLAQYPAALVAPFSLMVPAFAMLSTYLWFGEGYPLWKAMATLLIIAGLGVNQLGGLWHKRKMRPVDPPMAK